LNEKRWERSDLASFSQLVHEVIGGSVRRHTFTQWELELLLDLQNCKMRKAARTDMLRRYLKAVQQQLSQDGATLLRLSAFLEREGQGRGNGSASEALAAEAVQRSS
jgi:hypothetical protein